MTKTTFKEVKDAYIKLKSYVYYENFSIGLKADLAQFESRNLENKLRALVTDLNNYGTRPTKIEADISNINYYITPKKFKEEPVDQSNSFYFSTLNKKGKYEIDGVRKVTPFINCSIELHIVTILWIKRIGKLLDAKLDASCYGNRLIKLRKGATVVNPEIKLFSRYYFNYNKWRDSAIRVAKREYKKGRDVGILNLDIQSYFNSIDLDLAKLKVKTSDRWLNELLTMLHRNYSDKLRSDGFLKKSNVALPIGLISSNILANYYLIALDGLIQKKVDPAFYGRYVDDVIIVFSNPKINKSKPKFVPDFIEAQLSYTHIKQARGLKHKCQISRVDDDNFSITVDNNELLFQLSKVKLYHLHKTESLDILEGFEREIKKNSSEFKFQLETNDLIESFEDSSYDIVYGDTVNKIRSIEKFSANKFGASKHLARLINGTKDTSKIEKRKLNKVSDKILTFFSGKRALELVSLWDKVFTFFVINKRPEGLIAFSKNILNLVIDTEFNDPNLSAEQNARIEDHLKDGLLHQMMLSYAMAAALDISFFNAEVIKKLKHSFTDQMDSLLGDMSEGDIKRMARHLIKSNLFRQSYLPFPLINYCAQRNSHSFMSQKIHSQTSFKIAREKIEYSPRYISYNEVEMFYHLQSIFIGRKMSKAYTADRSDFVFKKYLEFNKAHATAYHRRFFPKKEENHLSPQIYLVDNYDTLKRIKVGIVNILVHEYLTFASLENKPVLSFERLDTLHKVLNEAISTKCDLVIFPEISVPFQWLSRLTEFSKRNGIGIICGVEHFANKKKEAFNYVATILPFEVDSFYKNSFLDLRLKIDYAPVEMKELNERGYRVPKGSATENLRVFKWRNAVFSVLNCFELTDINKRIKFKGEVDFLATIEFNRDIPYFSSINESLSRDLHCYVVQVNTSHYGDSRITLPSDSISRDFIKLKGGENISLVTGTLRIDSLREFQLHSLKGKKIPKLLEGKFKPLPPNFQISKHRNT